MEEWMADKDLTQYSNIPVLHYSTIPMFRLSLSTPGQEEAIVEFIPLLIEYIDDSRGHISH